MRALQCLKSKLVAPLFHKQIDVFAVIVGMSASISRLVFTEGSELSRLAFEFVETLPIQLSCFVQTLLQAHGGCQRCQHLTMFEACGYSFVQYGESLANVFFRFGSISALLSH